MSNHCLDVRERVNLSVLDNAKAVHSGAEAHGDLVVAVDESTDVGALCQVVALGAVWREVGKLVRVCRVVSADRNRERRVVVKLNGCNLVVGPVRHHKRDVRRRRVRWRRQGRWRRGLLHDDQFHVSVGGDDAVLPQAHVVASGGKSNRELQLAVNKSAALFRVRRRAAHTSHAHKEDILVRRDHVATVELERGWHHVWHVDLVLLVVLREARTSENLEVDLRRRRGRRRGHRRGRWRRRWRRNRRRAHRRLA